MRESSADGPPPVAPTTLPSAAVLAPPPHRCWARPRASRDIFISHDFRAAFMTPRRHFSIAAAPSAARRARLAISSCAAIRRRPRKAYRLAADYHRRAAAASYFAAMRDSSSHCHYRRTSLHALTILSRRRYTFLISHYIHIMLSSWVAS